MKLPTFTEQLKTLVSSGYPKALNLSKAEFEKLLEPLRKDCKSSLIVIPRQMLAAEKQMELMGGRSWLSESSITDDQESQEPYLIHDIEDGTAYRNVSCSEAKERILKSNRKPLTVSEGIALALHTEVLKDHYLDLVASRYGSVDWPLLYLYGDRPALGDGCDGDYEGWGAPSCREWSSGLGTLAPDGFPETLTLEFGGQRYEIPARKIK